MMRCVHWLAQRRRLLEFADKIFHRPDKHPEPLARGEGDLRLLVRHHVAHGGAGRAKGGHRERDDPGRRPRRAARKDVGQVAGTTHLTRPTGAGAVDTSLADLRHLFRWHFGPILKRCGQALVEMMLPFTAPLAERVVFEAVSFEVFWPWILGRYLRPAHPNAARSMWKAMGDRTSTSATLAEDGCEFTRLIPRSDWMDAVLRGDEAAMRNPVLNDTVELALSLWPNCSARLAGALKYYTVSPHATGPGSTPYFRGGGAQVRPACRRWRQPSKAWHWTRSCRPTTERPTTWPFSLS
jgi:hypothetical protein